MRGVRCAGGQARLSEDGESIVLLERAFGQQVLEELPAGQALLRSASRGRVGVCGGRLTFIIVAITFIFASSFRAVSSLPTLSLSTDATSVTGMFDSGRETVAARGVRRAARR